MKNQHAVISPSVLTAGQPPENILCLQYGAGAMCAFFAMIRSSRFVPDRDYVPLTDFNAIGNSLFRDQPQLLVTNWLGDDANHVGNIVQMWRSINPQLVLIQVTVVPNTPKECFDVNLSKLDVKWPIKLVELFKDFLEGRLRRKRH